MHGPRGLKIGLEREKIILGRYRPPECKRDKNIEGIQDTIGLLCRKEEIEVGVRFIRRHGADKGRLCTFGCTLTRGHPPRSHLSMGPAHHSHPC